MPALDGVRAFAVLAVLGYHGGVVWLRGGFLGVDAFFVLSGFLITSLLLSEWGGRNRIALSAFWARRARRLLPALFLMLAGVALYAAFVAAPDELATIRGDALSSLAYIANWHLIFSHQSYFEQFRAPSPLRHMWSLAIEEQFYLVWPLMVLGVLRCWRGSIRALACVAGGLAVVSATLMIVLYQPGLDPSRVYYGTDTRAWTLLVGALLAILCSRRPLGQTLGGRRALHASAVVAAVILGLMWSQASDLSSWLYEGGLIIAALLVAVVLADVSQAELGPLGKLLSLAPLRWIGAISYGLYLWHWPIFIYLSPARTRLGGSELFGLRVAATFAIATASYYLVEMPIRTGSWHGWRVRLAGPATAIGLAGVLVWATTGAATAGTEVSARDLRPPVAHAGTSPPGTGSRPLRLLLVGDSVANSLAPGLEQQASARGFEFWNAALPGCSIATEDGDHLESGYWVGPNPLCVPTWRTRWPQEIAQWRPDIVIMLMGGTYDRRIDGHVVLYDTPQGSALARADLDAGVRIFTAAGAHVVLLTTLYGRLGWPIPGFDQQRSGFNNAWVDRWNTMEREVAATDPGVTLVDLNALLDPGGQFAATINGTQTRVDGVHLTPQVSDLAAAWVLPQLPTTAPTSASAHRATPARR